MKSINFNFLVEVDGPLLLAMVLEVNFTLRNGKFLVMFYMNVNMKIRRFDHRSGSRWICLIHSFSMHHFSTFWKHLKTWCFQGVMNGCIGSEWVNKQTSEEKNGNILILKLPLERTKWDPWDLGWWQLSRLMS